MARGGPDRGSQRFRGRSCCLLSPGGRPGSPAGVPPEPSKHGRRGPSWGQGPCSRAAGVDLEGRPKHISPCWPRGWPGQESTLSSDCCCSATRASQVDWEGVPASQPPVTLWAPEALPALTQTTPVCAEEVRALLGPFAAQSCPATGLETSVNAQSSTGWRRNCSLHASPTLLCAGVGGHRRLPSPPPCPSVLSSLIFALAFLFLLL